MSKKTKDQNRFEIKERPILFSTEMVQAKLRGDKTQTRRVVKHQPPEGCEDDDPVVDWCDYDNQKGFQRCYASWETDKAPDGFHSVVCPYGKIGDLLWVRETFLELDRDHVITERYAYKANSDADTEELRKDYVKAGRPYKWKPSIHMPKSAARIWLKVTNVRVERLHQITDEDAKAEGVLKLSEEGFWKHYNSETHWCHSAKRSFETLWHSINGEESWDANPWVWVIEFEVVSRTGRP